MEYLWSIFVTNLLAVMVMMFGVWLLSLIKRDASIVDVFWGLGFVVVAWLTFLQADGYLGRKILITLLTTLWGLRLAMHILIRDWGHDEDRRYQAWRAQYGARFWWVSLFTVFGLQGLLLWVISLVLQVGQISAIPARLVILDFLGTIVWTVGFIFEAVADSRQIQRTKAK
jgi:steroid 5-alpha reductase family enzyme